MDKIYLVFGRFECEGGYVFGICEDRTRAEKLLEEAKKKTRCNTYYIEEMSLNEPHLLMI